MGGERSSTTRMRQAGKICCFCRNPLDYNIWDANPGERMCDRCIATRVEPPKPLHRVYMSFFLRDGWYCQFLEVDLKTSRPKKFTFATEEKVLEIIRRGGGMRDSAAKQSLEHALRNGRGGIYLDLTADQYEKLRVK